jgi:hypothetical protein
MLHHGPLQILIETTSLINVDLPSFPEVKVAKVNINLTSNDPHNTKSAKFEANFTVTFSMSCDLIKHGPIQLRLIRCSPHNDEEMDAAIRAHKISYWNYGESYDCEDGMWRDYRILRSHLQILEWQDWDGLDWLPSDDATHRLVDMRVGDRREVDKYT